MRRTDLWVHYGGHNAVTLRVLIFRYASFAVIATLANLAAQRLALPLTGFVIALGFGTIVGLGVKYVLDKRWIFYDLGSGVSDHAQKFGLYTLMGVFTTVIFWGTETAFWLIWQTDLMREAGAIIGLSIGYVIKYQLDRRFVFTDARLTQ